MNFLNGAINAFRNSASVECAVGLAVTLAVLHLEVTRRTVNQPQRSARREGGGFTTSCKKLLQQYAPEVAGLATCLSLAIALRMHSSGQQMTGNDEAYAAIMQQWPILLTADTLLALQAMLRLLVLISSVLRAGDEHTLISQEAAAISCGAALGRALLLACSKDYLLDGPLGGNLPVACELMSVPLLAVLCRGIHRRALTAAALTLAAAALIASRNQLSLANDALADGLFVFAHTAELVAAFAYLSRALLSDGSLSSMGGTSVALRFAHIVMPVQQCLAAYYFVQAFDYVPQLVRVGNPFEILQIGGVAQVGAYLGAAVLHLAEYLESPSEEPALPEQNLRAEAPHGHGPVPAPHDSASPQSETLVPRHAAVRALAL